MCDNAFDPLFDSIDLGVEQVVQIIILGLDIGRNVQLPTSFDLGFKSLCISTSCPLWVVKVLRMRRFSSGSFRPRFLEQREGHYLCGGNCRVTMPLAESSVQTNHSWLPVASNSTFTGTGISWIIATSATWPSVVLGCRNHCIPVRQNHPISHAIHQSQ